MDRRTVAGIALAGAVALAAGIAVGWAIADDGDPSPAPSPTALPEPSPVDPPSPSPSPTSSPSPTPSPSPSPSPDAADPPEVVAATISEELPASDGRPPTDVDVEYPQVTGLADADVQERVNTTLTDAMQAEVEAFLDAAADPAAGPGPGYGIQARYTVGAVTPRVLSAAVTLTSYTGGAHPYTVVRAFTFDLDDGEQLGLTDLFEPGVLERVSATAVERIQDEYATGEWAEEGAAPTEESLGRFVLTPDRLRIWFDNYQVGPYAIGTPSVEIPYTELADLVPPDGIVAHLTG